MLNTELCLFIQNKNNTYILKKKTNDSIYELI